MARAGGRNARVITTAAAVIAVVALTGAQKSCDTHRSSSTSGSGSSSGSNARSNARSDARSNASSANTTSSLRYSVSSDASIKSVTYINGDGHTVTRTNVGRTWSGSGPGDGHVMVKATLGDGSWIKCSVKARNKVVQRASASGGGSLTVVCDTRY